MSTHWLFHMLWLAIGVVTGAMSVACFSIVLAARGVRVAKKARHERDAMVKEVQRILAARSSQCWQAFSNGVALGLDSQSHRYEAGYVDALVGAETYEEPQ